MITLMCFGKKTYLINSEFVLLGARKLWNSNKNYKSIRQGYGMRLKYFFKLYKTLKNWVKPDLKSKLMRMQQEHIQQTKEKGS